MDLMCVTVKGIELITVVVNGTDLIIVIYRVYF